MISKDYDKLFNEILTQIIESEIPVRKIIKDSQISNGKFFDMLKDKKYSEQYARAMEIRAENMAFEILEIADDGSNDFMKIVKNDMEYEVENKEVTNRSRLRVDSRKWLLSKMLPKKYGDKIDTEHSGSMEIIVKPPVENAD